MCGPRQLEGVDKIQHVYSQCRPFITRVDRVSSNTRGLQEELRYNYHQLRSHSQYTLEIPEVLAGQKLNIFQSRMSIQ